MRDPLASIVNRGARILVAMGASSGLSVSAIEDPEDGSAALQFQVETPRARPSGAS